MNNVGNFIRSMRIEKGLLIREVSAELGIDSAYLSKIERGERQCKRELVNKISDTFSIDNDQLTILWLIDKIREIEESEPLVRTAIIQYIKE